MELTNDSKKLLVLSQRNSCITASNFNNATTNILKTLFNDIHNGVNFVNKLKKQNDWYNLNIQTINNISQIASPKTFSMNDFPPKIITHIRETINSTFIYTVPFFGKTITFTFLTEHLTPEKKTHKYTKYIEWMLVWLHIAKHYSTASCVGNLNVIIYFTSLKKCMPTNNINILDPIHINTAFTRTCPLNAEIVIYRREEWFKVFIHESFHNFGLDFSGINNNICVSKILKIFPVQTDVNLYEAYCESWARIINALFCGYIHTKTHDVNEFLINAHYFIDMERIYSAFQMVKVLNFMNLTYEQLYSQCDDCQSIRNMAYKENTNVLAYYVLSFILMYNYQHFMHWCNTNNISLFNFKKTPNNLKQFCNIFETKYNNKRMLKTVNCFEVVLHQYQLNKPHNKPYNKDMSYILSNTRMTCCELDY